MELNSSFCLHSISSLSSQMPLPATRPMPGERGRSSFSLGSLSWPWWAPLLPPLLTPPSHVGCWGKGASFSPMAALGPAGRPHHSITTLSGLLSRSSVLLCTMLLLGAITARARCSQPPQLLARQAGEALVYHFLKHHLAPSFLMFPEIITCMSKHIGQLSWRINFSCQVHTQHIFCMTFYIH